MPAIVDETSITPTEAAPITVPVGADTRTAASLLPAWLGLIARLKFLEAFYDLAKAITLGGSLSPAATLRLRLIGSVKLRVTDGEMYFDTGGWLNPSGQCKGTLFTRGQTGAANNKIGRIFSGSGTFDIDPERYNLIHVSGISGATVVRLTPVPTTDGLEVTVSTFSAGQQVQVADASNNPIHGPTTLRYASTYMQSVTVVWSEEIGNWFIKSRSPFDA